ncbi:PAS domain-containing protein [Adhaeribacter swui]|uniref:PAS domain-containing protein n=1 Tax=Adhaeribacter swui TaxID=2086471 RepID=A0A7G7G3B8_9BACT|nr:PAS domain-containing protein [Adhaeribacter swui]QNF31652.1 PAS domain-containing protein [Adhaeribacter swui]
MGNKPTNLNAMLGLDMYLASLSRGKCQKIKDQLKSVPITMHPLMSWDLAGTAYWNSFRKGRNINDLRKLTQLAHEYNWSVDLPTLLTSPYEALVLTNTEQVICWVNPGFTTMTGYPANFAIGQTPIFLQGENTSIVKIEQLQNQLKAGETFTGSILNYRLNKEEYLCQISIYPIKNNSQVITHFLALELEIR